MKKLTQLNESQYWQLIGLLALSKKHYDQVKFIEEAIADTLGVAEEMDDYYGHISDMVWNGVTNADSLLKKLEIKQP